MKIEKKNEKKWAVAETEMIKDSVKQKEKKQKKRE